ncbi:MAG: type IV secretion system DNA-binding domain-containing protein [bacterium]
MESFEAKNIPQFKSPEEEVAYLRAHLEKQERALALKGEEANKEKIADETIKAYRSMDSKDVLSPGHKLTSSEQEAFVLRLKPEPHDSIMEELLGVLLENGVKNALDIVDGMENPHVADDFHRFLVQYLQSTKKVPGLKESTVLYRALDTRLFEVTLPEVEEGKKKGLKELLSAMEQFYAGMHSIGFGRENKDKSHFTLEIALANNGEQFVIYASIPSGKVDLFEKQLVAVQPDAKLVEVTDDYNIFAEGRDTAVASYSKFAEHDIFPIKTYDSFDHDPMNIILNAFSKLKAQGEGAAIQFVLCPEDDALMHRFHLVLEDVKSGYSVKTARSIGRQIGFEFLRVGKELVFGSKPKEEGEHKVNERAVEHITEKLKSTLMATNIRIVASAENRERSTQILAELESAFNQFTEAGRNSFSWKRVVGSDLRALLHDFSFRMFNDSQSMPMNLKELSTIFHFPYGINKMPQLKQAKSTTAPAPIEMGTQGVALGTNTYRGETKKIVMSKEDRVRHFYVIGQTGTGKTTILKNMIAQDIANGDGCCFIDPHGTDIQDILSYIPRERIDDVIYFDPAYIQRPMGLNMLEYDVNYPEQKTFVVNELLAIFNKLFDMKTAGGPAFEQYFRNSSLLVMEDPDSGSTLLEIGRVLADKSFRDMKLSRCKNPIIKQFWENAEKTTGEQSLANFVPYITNKFDVFVSNDIMRPVIAQQQSVFNFRKIMDEKKILLVNLSKGRLGEINANLIGLILVGKIQMAALSRVDMFGKPMNDFYLYIDEFQNVTTDSIASILSEARKYRLSLNIAHQYIAQLGEKIRDAVFGNVGSMAVFRVGPDDAEYLAKQFDPVFTPQDIIKLENRTAYAKMLVNGTPVKPFNIATFPPPQGMEAIVPKIKELSYLKYGRDRAEVEEEIMARYTAGR